MDFLLLLLVYVGMFAILSLSQNIITGQTGLLSLGHAAFFAIGAYTMAIGLMAGLDFWPCFFLAGALAGLAGIVIGLPTLRLRGDYLAIATLGFGEITRNVLLNWDSLTRGPLGISGVPVARIAGIPLDQSHMGFFILVIWGFTLIVFLVMTHLNRSRIGLAMDAVREDEIAANAMGINVTLYKVIAFAVGAFFAGQAGTFWTIFNNSVTPNSFDFMLSVMILAMVVLGGMGNPLGSIVGAVIIQFIAEAPRLLNISHLISPQMRQIAFGLILVIMMIFRPQGIIRRRRIFHGPRSLAPAPSAGQGSIGSGTATGGDAQ